MERFIYNTRPVEDEDSISSIGTSSVEQSIKSSPQTKEPALVNDPDASFKGSQGWIGQNSLQRDISNAKHNKEETVLQVGAPAKNAVLANARPVKGILKKPRDHFPEEPYSTREGVALSKYDEDRKGIPPGARWTKISRNLVNPEALSIGQERFEVENDFIIVLRPLKKEQIESYVTATAQIREQRRRERGSRKYLDEQRDWGTLTEGIDKQINELSQLRDPRDDHRYNEVNGDENLPSRPPVPDSLGRKLQDETEESKGVEKSYPESVYHARYTFTPGIPLPPNQGFSHEPDDDHQGEETNTARAGVKKAGETDPFHHETLWKVPLGQRMIHSRMAPLQKAQPNHDEAEFRSNSHTPEPHVEDTPSISITRGASKDETIHCEHCKAEFRLGITGRRGQASNLQKHKSIYHPETIANKQASDTGRILDLDYVAAQLRSKRAASPGTTVAGTSEPDETSSAPSYNDTIFDELESVLSSVSSLDNDTQAVFVGAFVDLLLRDPNVERMIATATSDSGIGAERFRRSFSRILKMYSQDLRDTIAQEKQKEQKHQRVATFISRKTIQASSLLVTRYKERTPKSDNSALNKVGEYLDGLESDDSDSSNDEEPDTELTIAGLETFLLQGKPFKALKWHLRSLIIPNQRVTQVKASAEHLLNFMFCNLGLEEAFARAYARVPNFNAWLPSKIDVLAASLETELNARSPVVEYLRTYSVYLAAQALRKLSQRPHGQYAQASDSSPCHGWDDVYSTELRQSSEILEDIMVEKLPEVFGGEFSQQTTWVNLSSTKAFRDFFSDLSDTAYPTFFSECRKVLRAEVESNATEPSAQSDARYLLSILMELQWCSERHVRNFSLSIESSDSVPWVDRLKLVIEQSTGSEWSWWPLSSPPRADSRAHIQLEPLDLRQKLLTAALSVTRPMLFNGFPETSRSREHEDCAKVMSWTCTCGSTRRELLPSQYANLFQQLASEYPLTADCNNNPIQLTQLSVPQTPSQSCSGDSSSSADAQSIHSSVSTDEGSGGASVSTAPSSTDSTTITMDFDAQTFVHLLVRKADRYVLSSMKVTKKDARGFFQDLIVRYHQQRGLLRRIFSIFVYSHCDFLKVKQHRAYRFSPIPGFSFPERGKDTEYHDYTYSPQPMLQAPITRHMFNDYFYSCYDSHNLKHSFLHKFLSSCDVIGTLPQDLLDNMPKHDREVMVGAQFSRVEHFWGIVAREQRSALRVVVYMFLSLTPTIWFTFMWMFSWGHEGDLQSATVPVTLSLATLSMIWIVVYSGSDMRDE